MVAAIVVVGLLPFLVPTLNIRSSFFRPITRKLFWFQLVNCFILG